MYLIGYDIGSSSVKVALVEAASGKTVRVVKAPEHEMEITAPEVSWAEQSPELWWQYVCEGTRALLAATGVQATEVQAIGISYQMHGLVVVDEAQDVIRPSIIWCDSRAVEIGNAAFEAIGAEQCLSCLLNSPGNFTASKLKWVRDNEPELYARIHKIMLPGDFIAMKMSGTIATTISGLSEGVFWDFQKNQLSEDVLAHFGFSTDLFPEIKGTFSEQGVLHESAATALGLAVGTPITYRAGDQPNNALSLNVLQPGEVAATGGTSGVVYGVVDQPVYDPKSRVNGFAHVNYQVEAPRIGVLLCINGAGIQHSWMKQIAGSELDYEEVNRLAAEIPVGADGLVVLPYGNGAERVLENRQIGAQISGLNFNRHGRAHLFRAGLEGIAFAFVHGIRILKEMGMNISIMRVGNDNLFQSAIFAQTIATLADCQIDIIETTGAVGAARAAGVAVGVYASPEAAMQDIQVLERMYPQADKAAYEAAYAKWETALQRLLA